MSALNGFSAAKNKNGKTNCSVNAGQFFLYIVDKVTVNIVKLYLIKNGLGQPDRMDKEQ